jgi:hypothetical protein
MFSNGNLSHRRSDGAYKWFGWHLYSNLGKTMENAADCILSGAFPMNHLYSWKSHRPPMIFLDLQPQLISELGTTGKSYFFY